MYKPVVGLEIHLQVKTNSKMFCRCSNDYFHTEPNTHICPVCFGLPGALPMPNKLALEKAIKLATALNCEINKEIKFDRKNYFYPDLPKGYQISQFDKPVGIGGHVEIETSGQSKKIKLQRLHLEEDTAKSLHSDGDTTLIDYNKSGVPLIEMVTEPDFEDVEEVLLFAKRLRQIVRYTDVSDAEMQKGQMRFELNISVRPEGQSELPNYKVEVKNIGSISVLEKVLEFELKRQSEILEKGERIKSQTRGLKDMTGETLFQRSKETADDYRYFPEPDIAPISISQELKDKIKSEIPELPHQRKERYISYGLSEDQSDIFVEDKARGDYFDSIIKKDIPKEFYIDILNLINTVISGLVSKNKIEFDQVNVHAEDFKYLLELVNSKKITSNVAKTVIEQIFTNNKTAKEIIEQNNLTQIEDTDAIDKIINQVIEQNPKVVQDIVKNPNAIKFLVGQVMKLSKGRINPVEAESQLQQKLK